MSHALNLKRVLPLGLALTLGACAQHSGWTPTVDTHNNPNAERLAQDQAECRQLAKQASGDAGRQAVTSGLIGGALGAASGAAIGAVTGGAGEGAALGTAIGGIGGGARGATNANKQFKQAYINCLRNRGHNVIN